MYIFSVSWSLCQLGQFRSIVGDETTSFQSCGIYESWLIIADEWINNIWTEHMYRKITDIGRTKPQNLNDFRLDL